jgi:hypothetical protein
MSTMKETDRPEYLRARLAVRGVSVEIAPHGVLLNLSGDQAHITPKLARALAADLLDAALAVDEESDERAIAEAVLMLANA